MSVFLVLMVMGLIGLLMMALPAFSRHGHGAHAHLLHRAGLHRGGAAALHRGGAPAAVVPARFGAMKIDEAAVPALLLPSRLLRFLPSPRVVFTLAALYGAFGNAIVHVLHSRAAAGVLAVVPAFAVELLVVRPIWNLVFRYQGMPSSPFADLLLCEALAVVAFRNGRGLVSVVRDGRAVQLAAALRDDQKDVPVRVGDRLRVEDVDPARERLTVSIIPAGSRS